MLGFLYLSVSMLFSTLCSKRVTSLAAGVVLFFWSMIIGMVIFGLYLGTGGSFEELMSGKATFPDWVWYCIFISPMDMSQMAVMQAFGVGQCFGITIEVPSFLSIGILVFIQLVWVIVPLLLAYHIFEKKDI